MFESNIRTVLILCDFVGYFVSKLRICMPPPPPPPRSARRVKAWVNCAKIHTATCRVMNVGTI